MGKGGRPGVTPGAGPPVGVMLAGGLGFGLGGRAMGLGVGLLGVCAPRGLDFCFQTRIRSSLSISNTINSLHTIGSDSVSVLVRAFC